MLHLLLLLSPSQKVLISPIPSAPAVVALHNLALNVPLSLHLPLLDELEPHHERKIVAGGETFATNSVSAGLA